MHQQIYEKTIWCCQDYIFTHSGFNLKEVHSETCFIDSAKMLDLPPCSDNCINHLIDSIEKFIILGGFSITVSPLPDGKSWTFLLKMFHMMSLQMIQDITSSISSQRLQMWNTCRKTGAAPTATSEATTLQVEKLKQIFERNIFMVKQNDQHRHEHVFQRQIDRNPLTEESC